MPKVREEKLTVPRYSAAGSKEIWLTFDDGPQAVHTKKVLSVLAQHGVKATFFVVGRNCKINPQTLKDTFNAGHRIANHTYSHSKLTALSRAKVRDEILKTETLIAPYLRGRKLLRPPYGAHNAMVDDVAAELGYRMVLWNVDTLDWSPDFKPDKWVSHGIAQIKARHTSVVLNHDIHRTTAANLDTFISRIKAISGAKIQPAASL